MRVDAQGRPYFLWDLDMTLDAFCARLRDTDDEVRAYLVGKLLRQARPDDVARFVSDEEIRAIWPRAARYVGRSRAFWQERLGVDDQAKSPPRSGVSRRFRCGS